jgi:hypothetical protein
MPMAATRLIVTLSQAALDARRSAIEAKLLGKG